MKFEFDPIADAAYFEISTAEVETSKEIEPGIIVDYDKQGHVVGIEVLSISKRSRGIHAVATGKAAQAIVSAQAAERRA